MKGVDKYIVEVEIDTQKKLKSGSLELQGVDKEGDTYQNMPFHGVLVAAPPESKIPINEVVYMNYQSINSLEEIENSHYYVVDEGLIVAYGDDKKAFNCVTVNPKTQKLKSKLLTIIQTDLPEATKGVVLSSDVDFVSAGDEIEYEKNLDWEFIVERETSYYISWTDKIIKVNGEFVNGYVEIEQPEFINVAGLKFPNNSNKIQILSGEHKGKYAVMYNKRIKNVRYVKLKDIFAVL